LPFQPRKTSTRTEIIRLAAKLYLEEGYTATSSTKIAKMLDISQGNVTFYFPTKEHLLSVIVNELCDFMTFLAEKEAAEGISSILSYCLELVSIVTICEENSVAKDFLRSTYTSPLALDLVRVNDTAKSKRLFTEYCSDWTDEQWVSAENIVSGIEYALIMTTEEKTSLQRQIKDSLEIILSIYNIPEEMRKEKIQKVLNMNYREFACKVFEEFKDYIQKINDEALKQQLAHQKKRDPWKY